MSGYQNTICSNCSCAGMCGDAIAGGTLNCISITTGGKAASFADTNSCGNFIGGGVNNKILQCRIGDEYCMFVANAVLGGNQNHICGFVAGKLSTELADTCGNVIFGGDTNRICKAFGNGKTFNNAILAGRTNTIVGGQNNFIGGTGLTVAGYVDSAHFKNIVKVTNNFKINHPDPSKCNTHFLYHSTIESPTAGDNIYRYEVETVGCQASFDLPSYYQYLNENDQVWVTPKDHHGKAWACVTTDQTKVCVNSDTDGKYYVLVIGTRKDELGVHYWQGVERYKTPTHIVDYK
jgi:hypothetical protein